MQCFDFAQVRIGVANGARRPMAPLTVALLHSCHVVAKTLQVDQTRAVLEYRDACMTLINESKEGRPLAKATNSSIWEEVLDPEFHERCEPARPPLRVFPGIVRFYISIEDGSCQVDHDLGCLTGEAGEFTGCDTQLLDDLLLLKSAPEPAPEDICASAVGDYTCQLGELGQRWATLWRDVYGARLGCYDRKRTGQRRELKEGTCQWWQTLIPPGCLC